MDGVRVNPGMMRGWRWRGIMSCWWWEILRSCLCWRTFAATWRNCWWCLPLSPSQPLSTPSPAFLFYFLAPQKHQHICGRRLDANRMRLRLIWGFFLFIASSVVKVRQAERRTSLGKQVFRQTRFLKAPWKTPQRSNSQGFPPSSMCPWRHRNLATNFFFFKVWSNYPHCSLQCTPIALSSDLNFYKSYTLIHTVFKHFWQNFKETLLQYFYDTWEEFG